MLETLHREGFTFREYLLKYKLLQTFYFRLRLIKRKKRLEENCTKQLQKLNPQEEQSVSLMFAVLPFHLPIDLRSRFKRTRETNRQRNARNLFIRDSQFEPSYDFFVRATLLEYLSTWSIGRNRIGRSKGWCTRVRSASRSSHVDASDEE